MSVVLELPVPVFVGSPGEAPGALSEEAPVSRSHPDAATVVWCDRGAVDAEWDRPAPRVSRRLVFAPGEEVLSSDGTATVPFWVHWTAKESIYKKTWRATPFVPADHPLVELRELAPPGDGILRYFTWEGGFTACVEAPGDGVRRLWISVARKSPAPEMRNVS